MARMTEQEAGELDDTVTRAEITLGPNGSDWLSQREARLMGMDNLTVNYLWSRAEAEHTSPAAIIGELVRKELAAAM